VAYVEEKDSGRVVGVGTCRVPAGEGGGTAASVHPLPH
jgi:hypothetical protein